MPRRLILSFVVGTLLTGVACALSMNTAVSVQLENNKGNPGDIVSQTKGIYYLSAKTYDETMVGVIVETPVSYIQDTTLQNPKLVASSGEVKVNVSASKGDIAKGDYITSSEIPGVGVKAAEAGFTLGTALDDFAPSDKNQIGQISVLLDKKMNFVTAGVARNLLDSIQNGLACQIGRFIRINISYPQIVKSVGV